MKKRSKDGPELSRVLELMDFHHDTGIFTWRKTEHRNPYAGRRAGCLRPTGYRAIRIDYTIYQEHRLVWLLTRGEWPISDIDHINRDRSDNRPGNLRLATHSQNMGNMPAHRDSSHGFKGVSRHKRLGWFARIMVNRKNIFLGYHKTPEEAHKAYEKAAIKYRGEFGHAS